MERTRTASWHDPLIAASAARTMSGIDFLKAIVSGELPPPPIGKVLGFALVEASDGKAVFAVEAGEHLYSPLGTVHGGVAATLCDSAMACAIQTRLPAGAGCPTVELSVRFVKPVTAKAGRLLCTGRVIHVGGRTATAEARLEDEGGTLYAHAVTTCLVVQNSSAKPA